MQVTIRPSEARDRAASKPLWDGYIRLCEGKAVQHQALADAAIAG